LAFEMFVVQVVEVAYPSWLIVVWSTCLFSCSFPLPLAPLSLVVACAGNPKGMPTAREGRSKCKGRWVIGWGWWVWQCNRDSRVLPK